VTGKQRKDVCHLLSEEDLGERRESLFGGNTSVCLSESKMALRNKSLVRKENPAIRQKYTGTGPYARQNSFGAGQRNVSSW
jgi:hypothetical protein